MLLTELHPFNGIRWLLVKVIVALRSYNAEQTEPSSQGSQPGWNPAVLTLSAQGWGETVAAGSAPSRASGPKQDAKGQVQPAWEMGMGNQEVQLRCVSSNPIPASGCLRQQLPPGLVFRWQ